jgi:hypothetical protein
MRNDHVKVSVYLPAAMLARLRADAAEADRNLSAHVTRLCRTALAASDRRRDKGTRQGALIPSPCVESHDAHRL